MAAQAPDWSLERNADSVLGITLLHTLVKTLHEPRVGTHISSNGMMHHHLSLF